MLHELPVNLGKRCSFHPFTEHWWKTAEEIDLSKLCLFLDTPPVFVNICLQDMPKNYATNFCSYLHQILMDFRFMFHNHKVV